MRVPPSSVVIEIRHATPDDWQPLRDIRLAALAGDPDAFGSTLERELAFGETEWRGRARTSANFLALDGTHAVAIAAGYFDPECCARDERLLVSMWVQPAYRGRGLAAELVDAVVAWAMSDGARSVKLQVTIGNDGARRLYERAGFVAIGDAVPMNRDRRIREQWMVRRL
jgi:GNAT superfamily N-acetyltransferase